jgi:hypothetical protein
MTGTSASGEHQTASVDLTGSWRKSAGGDGELNYPDVLDFTTTTRAAGRYMGRKGRPEQGFLVWDAGSWRLTDDGRIEISTATDAIDSWPVTISDDEIQIHAADSDLTYRRTTGPDN